MWSDCGGGEREAPPSHAGFPSGGGGGCGAGGGAFWGLVGNDGDVDGFLVGGVEALEGADFFELEVVVGELLENRIIDGDEVFGLGWIAQRREGDGFEEI